MKRLVLAAIGVPLFAAPLSGQEKSEDERKEYLSTAKQTVVIHDKLAALTGKEARILSVEFPVAWVGDRHYHTGDVFVYVVEGEFTVDVEGEGRLTFRSGEVYHEALNTVMQARNLSTDVPTKVILFQVGDEGEPLMIKAE
jgi:quercetin dioxygenase-like cupin family protein